MVWCTVTGVLDKVYTVAFIVTLDSPDLEDEILFHIFFFNTLSLIFEIPQCMFFSRTMALILKQHLYLTCNLHRRYVIYQHIQFVWFGTKSLCISDTDVLYILKLLVFWDVRCHRPIMSGFRNVLAMVYTIYELLGFWTSSIIRY
jgi:hypothetical protein